MFKETKLFQFRIYAPKFQLPTFCDLVKDELQEAMAVIEHWLMTFGFPQ